MAAVRLRAELAKAELAEMDLAEREGQLVKVEEVDARNVALFTQCKTKLLGLPSRARQQDPALTSAQIVMLENLVREALTDLASAADELAPEDDQP